MYFTTENIQTPVEHGCLLDLFQTDQDQGKPNNILWTTYETKTDLTRSRDLCESLTLFHKWNEIIKFY